MADHNAQTASTQDEPVYDFVVYDRDGRLALMMVDQHLMRAASTGPTQAWFYLVAQNAAHLRALRAWITAREDQWQAWGAMARESANAFTAHLTALLQVEPLPEEWGYTLSRDPVDRRRLTLWALVDEPSGRQGRVAVWRRRFKTAADCSSAQEWLSKGTNVMLWEQLADAAERRGQKVVDAFIDRSVAAQL